MDSPVSVPAPVPKTAPARASDLLEDLLNAFPNETITVGEVLDRLEGRAFGLLLLLLALPNCVPNVPGLSTIFGVMMIAPAIQLILGRGALWMPRRVRAWTFSRDVFRTTIRASVPVLRRVEHFIRPRWTWLVHAPMTQVLGLQTLVMALVLMLPIPAGNWPPGMTVATTALALIQRDGRLALLSVPMAGVSLAIAWIGFRIGWAALRELGQIVHNGWLAVF
jgi:hypothetical protein